MNTVTPQLLTGTDACCHGTGSDSCQSWAADCSPPCTQLSLCCRTFPSDIRVLSFLTNTLHVWQNRCRHDAHISPKCLCIWSVVLVCMQTWRDRERDPLLWKSLVRVVLNDIYSLNSRKSSLLLAAPKGRGCEGSKIEQITSSFIKHRVRS